MSKLNGKVKRFNKEKGYGFIESENGKEYFFHYSSLNVKGFKTVDIGADVAFTPEQGEKGERATDIDVIK